MPTDRLFVVGAGGHARVVVDAARLAGHRDICVVDDDPGAIGTDVLNHPVTDRLAIASTFQPVFHVAIGDCAIRRAVFTELESHGGVPAIIQHPHACVAQAAEIGGATFLAAGCVVGPKSVLGQSTIINHNAVVDHDCSVGDFSHIAPGVVLGGGVRIGCDVLVGAGATILPGVSVGDRAVIAAGSTIVHDINDDEKVIFSINRKS